MVDRDRIDDEVSRGTLDYCAPEVIVALRLEQKALATTVMDVFSLGRMVQWMASNMDTSLWPQLADIVSEDDKERFLMNEEEFAVEMDHVPTKNLVVQMVRKRPQERMTLRRLVASSFFTNNLDTAMLRRA
jgi:serine/threonine protein kinase